MVQSSAGDVQELSAPATPDAVPPAVAEETTNGTTVKKKKHKKKSKKQYIPLPTLEALEDSLPFAVKFTQRLGRHAVAKHKIIAGELLLREVPVGSVIRTEQEKIVCHTCLKRLQAELHMGQMSRLAKVPGMSKHVDAGYKQYCSAACQSADLCRDMTAPVHAVIDQLAEESDVAPALLHFVVEMDAQRALLERSQGAEDKDGSPRDVQHNLNASGKEGDQANGVDATVSSIRETQEGMVEGQPLVRCGLADAEALLYHWDQKAENWRAVVSAACKRLHEAILALSAQAFDPSPVEKLQVLAAIVNSNAHGFGANEETNIDCGLGLFPVLSMLNHSCRPNCGFHAVGKEMQVRALRDIADGEQLCVSYINLMEDRPTRQSHLLENKYFQCSCERCSEPLSTSTDRFLEGLACGESGCPGPMVATAEAPVDPTQSLEWQCCTCKRTHSGATLFERPEQRLSSIGTRLRQAFIVAKQHGHGAAVPMFEEIVGKAPSFLHPQHVFVFDSLMPLVNGMRQRGEIQAAVKYLQRLIASMDEILGQHSAELGNLLDLLARLLEERMAKNQGAARTMLARQCREANVRTAAVKTVTLGASHPGVAAANARLRRIKA